MRQLLACLAICFGSVAQSDTLMTADEFRKKVEGRTFSFATNGITYGREHYLPGDRVIWDDMAGNVCRYGSWYQQSELLCFVYDDRPDSPRCWAIHPEIAGAHILYFENDPNAGGPYVMTPSTAPIMCTGPNVGV